MSGDSAKSRMGRILRLHEEIDAIKADIKDIYAEEKADGGDKTAMGAAISIIRKREKDATAFDEQQGLVDVYLTAYLGTGTSVATHTHAPEPQVEPRPVETGVVEVERSTDDSGLTSPVESEAVAISTPIQSETEAPYVPQPVVIGQNMGVAAQITEGLKEALAVVKGEAEPAAVHVLTPKPLRPYCQNPGNGCGGIGKQHCWKCQKAHDEAQGAA
jgi:uncharacterized protein (UPF0335 family)